LTIQPRPLEAAEPILGQHPILGGGRETHRIRAIQHRLQPFPPDRQRHRAQILIADREQVPRHERRRRLRRQQLYPRRRRMDAQQKRLEVEPLLADDHDLPIDHAPLRQRRHQRRDQLRKITVHRLRIPALQHQLVAIAEHERPKPIPLRLEQPPIAFRQPIRRGRQHRLEGRGEGKRHGCEW
jgi:hypothetical protein